MPTKLTQKSVFAIIAKGTAKMYCDSQARGLYLKTTPSKTGSWIYRWRDRKTTKLREMGLGSIRDVSLDEARHEASCLRKLIKTGIDPIAERRKRLSEERATETFREVCHVYFKSKVLPTGHTDKNKRRWLAMMKSHAFPVIGDMPIDEIDTISVMRVLDPIWLEKIDTAKRVRQNIEKVLSHATVMGQRSGDNPARWKGHLDASLASPGEVKKAKPVQHRPAVCWQEIGEVVGNLRKREGMAARALEFAILTAARTSEVRYATWDEVSLEDRVWIIPKERMLKNNRAHTVPLSDDAIALLKSLPPQTEPHYLFPSSKKGKALSDMTLSAVLRRMKIDKTVHGFRSTFKDWARNMTDYADEVSELALSHVNDDATRAAYARDTLIEPRKKMMQEWAIYLQIPAA